jgi:hypothetical protein
VSGLGSGMTSALQSTGKMCVKASKADTRELGDWWRSERGRMSSRPAGHSLRRPLQSLHALVVTDKVGCARGSLMTMLMTPSGRRNHLHVVCDVRRTMTAIGECEATLIRARNTQVSVYSVSTTGSA